MWHCVGTPSRVPPIQIPVVILFVKQTNILRHAESVLEFIGWYELLSVKKRLLNLRTSWAVISEGKATDAKWGWTRACSCGCGWWLNQRQRARRLSHNSVSSHRLLPLPEISALSDSTICNVEHKHVLWALSQATLPLPGIFCSLQLDLCLPLALSALSLCLYCGAYHCIASVDFLSISFSDLLPWF